MSPIPDIFGLATIKADVEALKAKNNSHASQLTNAQSTISSLQTRVDQLTNKVSGLKALTSAQETMINSLVSKKSVVSSLLTDGPKLHSFITNPAGTVNSLADARIRSLVNSSLINPLITSTRIQALVKGKWPNIDKIPSILSDISTLKSDVLDIIDESGIKNLINADYIKNIISAGYIKGIANESYIKAFWPYLDKLDTFGGRLGSIKSDLTGMKTDFVNFISAHKSFISAFDSIVTTIDDMATGGADKKRPSVTSWAVSLYNNFNTLKSRGITLKSRLDQLDDEFGDLITRFTV